MSWPDAARTPRARQAAFAYLDPLVSDAGVDLQAVLRVRMLGRQGSMLDAGQDRSDDDRDHRLEIGCAEPVAPTEPP